MVRWVGARRLKGRFRFFLRLKKLKTNVYIDGFNLYYRCLRWTPYKWLNIKELLDIVLTKSHNIIKIKYFTAPVKSSSNDKSKPERQATYWRALDSIPNLEIVKGKFKKRQVKGRLLQSTVKELQKGSIVSVEKYEEKESDVNIASHILFDCCKADLDSIILLSNDTDLKTPLHFARKNFKKKVGIISPTKEKNEIHQDLKKVSHFSVNITDELLKQCQFSAVVNKIRKPVSW